MRIGRWSDESCLKVVQRAELVRLVGSIVRSGEVGCWRCWCVGMGSLVGLLSFIIVWEESLMMLLMVIPLWSL